MITGIDREAHPFRVRIAARDVGLMKRYRVHIGERYIHLSCEQAVIGFLDGRRNALIEVLIDGTETYTSWEVAA